MVIFALLSRNKTFPLLIEQTSIENLLKGHLVDNAISISQFFMTEATCFEIEFIVI